MIEQWRGAHARERSGTGDVTVVTGKRERAEVYTLPLPSRVGEMVHNSLELTQMQTQPPNLLPS